MFQLNPTDFRHAFRVYLNDDHQYRKFIAKLHHTKRLLFWQETLLNGFLQTIDVAMPDFAELQGLFRVCEVHDCPLIEGEATIFGGEIYFGNEAPNLKKARADLFPNLGRTLILGSPSQHGQTVPMWYCPECVAASKAWHQRSTESSI